jgi:acyl-coenzyme A synthetase/AMP-(fatty) acid ligase
MLLNEIYQWARIQPTKPALIHNDTVWDYADFAKAIAMARKLLQKENLPERITVIILASNLYASWPILIALRSLGVNTAVVPSIEVAQALQLTDVARIVTTELGHEFFKLHKHSLPGIGVSSVPNLVQAEIHAAAMPESPALNAAPGAHILYTSGTTGAYKKVKIDASTEAEQNFIRERILSINSGTICQGNNMQPWTGIGFKTPRAVWNAGGTMVFNQVTDRSQSVFDPIRFFRHNVNLASLIPWQLRDLLQSTHGSEKRDDFRLYIAGGLLPFALAHDAIGKLTNHLKAYYSARELGAPAMVSAPDHSDALSWLVPTFGRCIQIVDETGKLCPTGQQGELRIRCEDADCKAYLDDEETTARVFRDGFFYPGDMAVSRDDGAIRILGRLSDVINIKGEKLAVGPIEQLLCQRLSVDEVCLFTNLNDEGEEELIIALQSEKRPPRDRLDQVKKQFPNFDRVRFACLREFPRTDPGTGKVRRPELKALILSGKDEAQSITDLVTGT